MITFLNMARDELLPMVYSASTRDTTLNIYIEERQDAIVISGHNHRLSRELGFAITGNAIRDGVYRSAWLRESIRRLVYMLEFDPEQFRKEQELAHKEIQSWSIH